MSYVSKNSAGTLLVRRKREEDTSLLTYAGLLECALRQEQSLDPGETLVRIVVGLFDESELFTLGRIQAPLHAIGLLQLLEGQHEELGIMLV